MESMSTPAMRLVMAHRILSILTSSISESPDDTVIPVAKLTFPNEVESTHKSSHKKPQMITFDCVSTLLDFSADCAAQI